MGGLDAPEVPTSVDIFDTTLRDGSQQEGLSLTVDDKLRVAEQLDHLGVAYIEGGWPGANPKDVEFFARAPVELQLQTATLVVFGSTRRPGECGRRRGPCNLVKADTEAVCIVAKSSEPHVTEALRTSLDEALAMAADSVAFLKEHDLRVFFDAEHFFDGYKANPEFSTRVLRAAADAGAETLVLCDTNGGTLPYEVEQIVAEMVATFDSQIGVHFHNDAGCAVANSLAGVRAGATQVQGCVNGYGERAGNADLSAAIPNLSLKLRIRTIPARQARAAYPGRAPHSRAREPVTEPPAALRRDRRVRTQGGAAHERHRPAARRLRAHPARHRRKRDPLRSVRARRKVDACAQGRAARAEPALGRPGRGADDSQVARAPGVPFRGGRRLSGALAASGNGVDACVLRPRELPGHLGPRRQGHLGPQRQRHLGPRRQGHLGHDGRAMTEATVKVRVSGERVVATAEGNGPVNALDSALRQAIGRYYPSLAHIHLVDYRVRVLDSNLGTGAVTRVLIDTTDGEVTWTTIGVSENIIEASWQALYDSIVYGLSHSVAGAQPVDQPVEDA